MKFILEKKKTERKIYFIKHRWNIELRTQPGRGVHVVFNQWKFKHSLRSSSSFPKVREGNETISFPGSLIFLTTRWEPPGAVRWETQETRLGTKLRASTVGQKPFLPNPLPLLPLFFAHPSPLLSIFLLTPGALVCSLACSISLPGKWKETSVTPDN